MRYAPLFCATGTAAGPPMLEVDHATGCCSDICTCAEQKNAALAPAGAGTGAAKEAWEAPPPGAQEWKGDSSPQVIRNPLVNVQVLEAAAAVAAPLSPPQPAAGTGTGTGSASAPPPTAASPPRHTPGPPSLPTATGVLALAALAILSQAPPAQAALVVPTCSFTDTQAAALPLNISLLCSSTSGLASAQGSIAAQDSVAVRIAHSPNGFPWCTHVLALSVSAASDPSPGTGGEQPRSAFSLGPIQCPAPPCCLIAECRGWLGAGGACSPLLLDAWLVAPVPSATATPTPSPTPTLSPGASPSASPTPAPSPLSSLFVPQSGAACAGSGEALVAAGQECQDSPLAGFSVRVENPNAAPFRLRLDFGVEACAALGRLQPRGSALEVSSSATSFALPPTTCNGGACCFTLECMSAFPCLGLRYSWAVTPPPVYPASFWATLGVALAVLGGLMALRLACPARAFAALDKAGCSCAPASAAYASVPVAAKEGGATV